MERRVSQPRSKLMDDADVTKASTAKSLSLNVQLSHLRKILSADPRVTIVTVKGKGLMMNVEKNQSTTV